MITRPVPKPYTCLRCRQRLSRGAAASRLQAVFSSTDSGPKPNAENLGDFSSNKKDRPIQTRRILMPLSEFTRTSRKPFKEYRVVDEPLGQFYGFSGHKLFKENEPLNVNKFGDPAEVIILRETKIHRYAAHDPSLKQKASEDVDILARLESERGIVGQAEIEENINEFRPSKGQEPKNWDEFNELVRCLQDAFTNIQLEKYIDSFAAKKVSGLSIEPLSTTTSADDNILILQRSHWEPEYLDSGDYFEDASLRGYALASHTAKQRVVVRLLRECWKLELPELADPIGQAEIRIRPGDLDLLSKDSILDYIKESLLAGNEEKLEAFPSHGIIRITAREKKSDWVINEIEQVLQNIKRITLSLTDLMPLPKTSSSKTGQYIRKWADATFNDTTLVELGSITNTNITRLPDTLSGARKERSISISCLTTPNNPWLSNRANMAQRLLITAGDFSNRNQHQLTYKKMPEGKSGSFVKHSSIEGLHWHDQFREWTRWTVPIHRETTSRGTDLVQNQVNGRPRSASDDSEKRELLTLASPSLVSPSAPTRATYDTGKYWSDTYKSESSAIFGSVLHCHEDSTPEVISETPWGGNKTIHTFSPALPTLSPIVQHAELPRHLRTEVLTLRFQPNPFYVDPQTNRTVGAGVLSAFPPLEMHFDVSLKDRNLTLRSVDAIVDQSKTDLMLPDYAVDVRFHQKKTSRLRRRWLDLPEIQEFLKCSNLSWTDRRIDLPPTLNMRIANHLCKKPELEMLGRSTDIELHDVEYLFAGRETRSTLTLGHQNWKLLYTTIDQGKAEGRRSELKLRPISTTEGGTEEEYLETVLNLADAFGTDSMFSARGVSKKDEGPARMVVMSLDKSSKPVGMLTAYIIKRFRFGFLENDAEDIDPAIDNSEQPGDDIGPDEAVGGEVNTESRASEGSQLTESRGELKVQEEDLDTYHPETNPQPKTNPTDQEAIQEEGK